MPKFRLSDILWNNLRAFFVESIACLSWFLHTEHYCALSTRKTSLISPRHVCNSEIYLWVKNNVLFGDGMDLTSHWSRRPLPPPMGSNIFGLGGVRTCTVFFSIIKHWYRHICFCEHFHLYCCIFANPYYK